MYEYLKGKLIAADPHRATLEVSGIGYSLLIPLSTYSKLPDPGENVLLYTSLIVREDSHTLFAFLSAEERDLFRSSCSISGIGPKTALALVGHLDQDDLHTAIASGNVSLLSKVPGIGKKTAERLILEMRDKLVKGDSKKISVPHGDALNALINLGYNSLQAQKAIKKALAHFDSEPELGDLIRVALRGL